MVSRKEPYNNYKELIQQLTHLETVETIPSGLGKAITHIY